MRLPQCECTPGSLEWPGANILSLLLYRYSLAATVQVRPINPSSSARFNEWC